MKTNKFSFKPTSTKIIIFGVVLFVVIASILVIVNLVNINQSRHSLSYSSYDEVMPINDITIQINTPYKSVSLPFNEKHSVEYKDDCVVVKIDQLDIHTAIICK